MIGDTLGNRPGDNCRPLQKAVYGDSGGFEPELCSLDERKESAKEKSGFDLTGVKARFLFSMEVLIELDSGNNPGLVTLGSVFSFP